MSRFSEISSPLSVGEGKKEGEKWVVGRKIEITLFFSYHTLFGSKELLQKFHSFKLASSSSLLPLS